VKTESSDKKLQSFFHDFEWNYTVIEKEITQPCLWNIERTELSLGITFLNIFLAGEFLVLNEKK